MEATRRDGLRARTCQTARKTKRKESHRKPLLPDLRVADVIGWVSVHVNNFIWLLKNRFDEILAVLLVIAVSLSAISFLVAEYLFLRYVL